MHVVHLYDGHEHVYEGRGSVPGVVWNIAKETAANDHEVTVVERQWDGLDTVAAHEGVSFHRLALSTGADEPWTRVPYEEVTSPVGALRLVGDRTNFARAAYGVVRALAPDIIHVHLPFAAAVLATTAPWLRRRMVYTAHLGDLRLNLLDTDAESDVNVPGILNVFSPDVYLARRVAHTTVLNHDIRDAFVDSGVDRATVSVVPNGVDTARFASPEPTAVEGARSQYSESERPLVLFLGTVMPRKGVVELVRAFETVATSRDPAPQLVIAGNDELDTEYVSRVESFIAESPVGTSIDVVGFVREELLPGLYHVADVVVVPSLEEGFGMTAIEAMAAGTPVVGTRVGGLPEIIENGETGYLVDPGDPDALADALLRVLESGPGTDYDQATRARASDFSWSGVAARVCGIYDEVDE